MDWLDLARYADTYGYQADVDRDMSPYRDWVIRAFNDNLPYDQFLTWQLAGDLLPRATRDQRVATAFNRLHRQTNEGGSIEEEFRAEYAVDRVNTFGTAMLGLTVECARCHDHKFDPITQREYFSLFAFFNNIDESGLYSHFTNATPTPALLLWPAGRIEPRDRHCGTHRRNRTPPEGTGAVRTRAVREMDRERAAVAHPCACRTPRIRRCQCRHERCGQRKERCPDDTGSRGRSTRTTAGRSAARSGARAERERRAAIQRRQQRGAPGCADVRAHGSLFVVDPADAYRRATARGRPAPVAGLDRRRQPRLRADARRRPAVLRADSFLAGERDRGSRYTRAPAERVVAAHRDLRRIEPRRGHPAVSRWRTARYRRRARSPGEGHLVPAGGRRSIGGHASVDAGRQVPRQRLQERPDRRSAGVRRRADGRRNCKPVLRSSIGSHASEGGCVRAFPRARASAVRRHRHGPPAAA